MGYYDAINAVEQKPSKSTFISFVTTQTMGKYNMLSKEARFATSATDGEYNYILKHYEELSCEYEITPKSPEILEQVRLRKRFNLL